MSIILRVGPAHQSRWKSTLAAQLPELGVRLWDEPGNDEDIRYAVVWRPPAGGLRRFTNLECIVSIGAGIDHVYADPELPAVPIIKTVGNVLRQRMREYVCAQVLRFHRGLDLLDEAAARSQWAPRADPPADQRVVGIMGLGSMGLLCAQTLASLGFAVHAWTRSPRAVPDIKTWAGPAEFDDFLATVDILVCLLPLTDATRSILSAKTFSRLKPDACLINVGRGDHLVEDDLIPALESGQLRAAALDVFQIEPLPQEHPFWDHPNVHVTPHVASLISPDLGATLIANNLRRFIAGESVPDLVPVGRGY